MHASHGWLPDATTAWIALSVFAALVLLHALWRSIGEAAPDPVRDSGPIV